MSEVLPNTLDGLSEFPDGVEGATGEFLRNIDYVAGKEPGGFLSEFHSKIKPIITNLVKRAFDVPAYSSAVNQRNAISDFENSSFESCYEGFEEHFGTSPD